MKNTFVTKIALAGLAYVAVLNSARADGSVAHLLASKIPAGLRTGTTPNDYVPCQVTTSFLSENGVKTVVIDIKVAKPSKYADVRYVYSEMPDGTPAQGYALDSAGENSIVTAFVNSSNLASGPYNRAHQQLQYRNLSQGENIRVSSTTKAGDETVTGSCNLRGDIRF